MLAIDVDQDPTHPLNAAELAARALLEQRLIVNATGPATLRLEPPLIVSDDEARRGRGPAGGARAMTASELLLPDEVTTRGAGEAIAAALEVEDGVRYERDRIYYDTFDGLVRGDGLTLTHAEGTLSLASQETGVIVASLPMRAPTKQLFARDLPSGPLRDMLVPITDVRALLPLVHLHSRERLLSVLDDERKTVVRLALEETTLVGSDGPDAALRPRVRITGMRGYDKGSRRVPADARRRAWLQACRPAARRRGGQGLRRRARGAADEGRDPAPARAAR